MANPNFNVSAFKSKLQFGGARSTLFQVQLSSPPTGLTGIQDALGRDAPFLIKAASLPASTLGLIQVPYFGRTVKMAGDRTFTPWQVTVINDEDFKIRNALETWSNAINQMRGNTRLQDAANLSYKASLTVTQFSKTGEALRTYTFEGAYPQEVSAIELAWQNTDTIEEFQVTFEYDNWTVTSGTLRPGDQG
jgi:hypothetical protein